MRLLVRKIFVSDGQTVEAIHRCQAAAAATGDMGRAMTLVQPLNRPVALPFDQLEQELDAKRVLNNYGER